MNRPRTQARLVAAGLLLAGALSASAATGQEVGARSDSWLADSLQMAVLAMPDPPGSCPATPHGPHRLPRRPTGPFLGLVYCDGRPSRWDSLQVVGGVLHWPVETACHALGASLDWNPELMRGEMLLGDSLTCGFIVGGEFLHCGDVVLQMRAPVLYLGNRVLLPLEGVELLAGGPLAGHYRFAEESTVLVQQPASGPPAAVESGQSGQRTTFAWPLPAHQEAAFWTDEIGTIVVEVPGVVLDPLHPPAPEPKMGGCLWALRPWAGGVTYVLRIDSGVRAWQMQTRTRPAELRLTLSTHARDLEDPDYRPWGRAGGAYQAGGLRPIALVVAGGGGAQTELLENAARRVSRQLESIGLAVEVVQSEGQGGWVRGLQSRRPSVCLCLLPDETDGRLLPGLRLVSTEPWPGGRPLAPLAQRHKPDRVTGDLALERWEAASARHAAETHRLGWMADLHLAAEFPELPIAREHWPSDLLDGLDAPALLIYVGDLGDPFGPASPEERLAGAVSSALRGFLLGGGRG